jgi:hypothetical protein
MVKGYVGYKAPQRRGSTGAAGAPVSTVGDLMDSLMTGGRDEIDEMIDENTRHGT